MTQDHSLRVLAFILYLIGGAFTGWGASQNGAPKHVALFLAITYPIVLPVCIAYAAVVTWNKNY